MTWEQAVQLIRDDPAKADLARDAYYDDPLTEAAQRYHASTEWQAIRVIIGKGEGRTALEIGAGRGIASYALAREGFQVTALEPDPSAIAGAAAIRDLATQTGVSIKVVEEYSETLPFEDASFDVVFARAVLHHTRDLAGAIAEMARVLRPGGMLVAVREHVISRDEDLPAFLASHPMHHLYGGENAFRLDQYVGAIRAAGLALDPPLAPLESPINYWPHTAATLRHEIAARFRKLPGAPLAVGAALAMPGLGRAMIGLAGRFDHRPGRLYSFVARRR
ncbi:class I SAM-dependent methyltransferase [Sphingomonas sp.]|uniref:class I SAM-dependent methyltransferase n=1 Tax=Sphingomonas sp. TaxID=28214 RepID=UPI001D8745DA|nr:class I SAM-dependent methyltransferase [Sphingomonas sp.]MBX9795997.1 methyltransferase domain-containing protein [Sphingomonas sp.]